MSRQTGFAVAFVNLEQIVLVARSGLCAGVDGLRSGVAIGEDPAAIGRAELLPNFPGLVVPRLVTSLVDCALGGGGLALVPGLLPGLRLLLPVASVA